MTNNISPQYETRIIELPKGITIGGELHKQITIREQTVGDIVDASHASTQDEKIFKQIAKRVTLLGNIENPGETLLRHINANDFAFILKASMEMDGVLDAEDEDEPVKKPVTPSANPDNMS